jgi:hypothetical protein
MKQRRGVRLAILLAAVLLGRLATGTAMAQTQAPAAVPPSTELAGVGIQPPFATAYEGHLTVRADRTATEVSTKRIKILTPSVIQTLSQQQLQFIEGMQTLETLEAYTEKSDGRHTPVDPANIMTRDGASGLASTFVADLKLRTIIFPDVAVGDTLVMTNKTEILQDQFAGQLNYFDVFPRSASLSSVKLTIEAPASLDLIVKVSGNATTDQVETLNGVRRHTITVVPESYRPEEPGAVSPIDREPSVMASTFHSYAELGAAYGKAALPKIQVTQEIASLADQITRGIAGHRAQAAAIDAWVKQNIRYVAIFLSVGRVVPHEAEAILHNKFGDCKDKVTLMSALLAAKGIASEAALINLGNGYTLPEPPTLAALNHVILYLPEFDIYDDPTANMAAFGVLAAEAYDKPVVRVAASGAQLARTPAMKPAEHISHATTTIKIAADGAVSGQTQESNTGILGMALRYAGAIVQQAGDETVAQRQLQSFNTPGTGHIELGNSSATLDPVAIKGTFTLTAPFRAPAPGGIAAVTVGMPLTVRPGNFLLGARLAGRLSAFVCWAGTQIEDIEATFDPKLPMPGALSPTTIDNPAFSYRSTFRIEDRTLKVHREFVSRVPSQSCPPQTEAQISADMDKVRADVNTAYRFGTAAPAPPAVPSVNVAVTAGQKRRVDFLATIEVDCSSTGFATVTTVEPPQHGTITVDHGTGTTNFPQSNPRFECNKRQSDGTVITYEPAAGFTGADAITVDIVYASGAPARRHYSISVNPVREAAAPPTATAPAPAPPAITVVSRVAIADKPLQLAFLYDMNPDCSVIGVPTVRIVEQPKSGKATIENGTGFPAFPASNPRSKCNQSRSDGAIISYTPDPGYTGADSITVDIIYPDGSAAKRRYAIEVK